MVNCFIKMYSLIPSNNNGIKFLEKIRYYSALRFLVRSMANIFLPLYFLFTSNFPSYQLRNSKVELNRKRLIVSLTSFPLRIDKVWLVIETILRQKMKPDKLILWLSKEQFDGIKALPNKLKNQIKRGLEIKFVDGDILSHKKYYYAMKVFPDDLIITIDDDIFYKDNLLETMIKYHSENPLNIIVFYCKNIKRENNELCEYSSWVTTKEVKESISELFFGSGGGTLFPPHSLYDDLLKVDLFLKLTPMADDIWLNTMSRLNKTPIYYVLNNYNTILPIMFKRNKTLAKHNVNDNMNDVQLANVRNYYLDTLKIDPFRKIDLM